MQGIDELGLPQQKPIQYIRADNSKNINADIRITLHGFRGDSGLNEVEQTNSGVRVGKVQKV